MPRPPWPSWGAAKANEEQAAKLAAELAEMAKTGATTAEMEKAKKTSSFYPEPASAEGKALAQQWNEKYAGKQLTEPAQFSEKVVAYKQTAAQIKALEEKNQTAAQAAAKVAAAKASEEQKEMMAAAAAKAAEEKAKQEVEVKEIMAKLGLADPHDVDAFSGFVELAGGNTSQLISQFKAFENSGNHHGYLPSNLPT
jgi:hypothetical protein